MIQDEERKRLVSLAQEHVTEASEADFRSIVLEAAELTDTVSFTIMPEQLRTLAGLCVLIGDFLQRAQLVGLLAVGIAQMNAQSNPNGGEPELPDEALEPFFEAAAAALDTREQAQADRDAEIERLRNMPESEARESAVWARRRLERIARRNGVPASHLSSLTDRQLAELAGWKHNVLTRLVRDTAGLPELPAVS